MAQIKTGLLSDRVFLIGLITLLINDLFLKYEIGGFVTGKLSDVSGLFIFPFFWSIFFERHKLKVYFFTVIGFILWKLPITTGAIEAVNHILDTNFHRVIDYTDLITLLILPFSYKYLNRVLLNYEQRRQSTALVPILITLISLFAFVATSLPHMEIKEPLVINERLVCHVSKSEIFQNRINPWSEERNLKRSLSDSSFQIFFPMGRTQVRVWVKVYPLDSIRTMFELDSLHSCSINGKLFSGIDNEDIEIAQNLTREKLVDLFHEKVIKVIEDKRKKETNIYYFSNPEY